MSLFFCLPSLAWAKVVISEVAWMGDVVSVNHEWIELHNEGEAVNIDGWSLTDDNNLNISLAGEIPSGSYVVLERTNDDSAPGNAFLFYTGALVNSGASLTLKDQNGQVVDRVAGGEEWQNIGGDNETKETAQKITSGWVTAAATPGLPSLPQSEGTNNVPSTDTVSSGGKLTKPQRTESVKLGEQTTPLKLDLEAPTIGYVNQTIPMKVDASGSGKTIINSLVYNWNFGNGQTAKGKVIDTVYQFPGKYVVVVQAKFKAREEMVRHEITILPVRISLTINQTGDVQINNDSPYEIDLSNYELKGEGSVVFPPRTIILPNQTITIAKAKLGDTKNQMVAIYDNKRQLTNSLLPSVISNLQIVTESPLVTKSSYESTASEFQYPNDNLSDETAAIANEFRFSNHDEELNQSNMVANGLLAENSAEIETMNQNSTGVTRVPLEKENNNWPYVALTAVIMIGVAGVLAVPRRNEKS